MVEGLSEDKTVNFLVQRSGKNFSSLRITVLFFLFFFNTMRLIVKISHINNATQNLNNMLKLAC